MGCAAALTIGCVPYPELPPPGAPLPYTVKIELPPSIAQETVHYYDSCGQPGAIPIGRRIETAVRKEASRTFAAVIDDADASVPNHVIKLEVRDLFFALDKDALYDRAPAVLRMNVTARTYDGQGALLRETEFQVNRRERVRLERLGRNCDYIIDPFIQNTAVELASNIFQDARVAFGDQPLSPPISQEPQPDSQPPSPAVDFSSGDTHSASPALRFKALLLDENNNLILEGGEHVYVRIDVVNVGARTIHNAAASLTGTPAVLRQFPATTLTIPPLQPGHTKSLEFVATLPPTTTPQQAEIHVSVTESGGLTPPTQTLSLTIHPAGTGTDNGHAIPAPTPPPQ